MARSSRASMLKPCPSALPYPILSPLSTDIWLFNSPRTLSLHNQLVRTRKQSSFGFHRCATAGHHSIAQLLSSASSVPNPTRAPLYLKRCWTTDPALGSHSDWTLGYRRGGVEHEVLLDGGDGEDDKELRGTSPVSPIVSLS
ncbi:hypothetical protein PGTUg99_005511 [Puccinia graminis f. sp. tritici]|uniref:Uncharacterized protein n=1 Tax=Puccinia graminis f. sp. tritici TaxID=56615 RepID=A0A5B0MM87_PUCGR|nr:hypothetical protein PGTUg99_005511 [Puccinia graminis f. sp. tritici]